MTVVGVGVGVGVGQKTASAPASNPDSNSNSDIVYRNFIGTCRTSSTRYIYEKALRYFLWYLRLASQDYAKLLDMDTNSTNEYLRLYFLPKKPERTGITDCNCIC